MRINEIITLNFSIKENATAGATSAANIGTVVSPHIAIGKARGKKSYTGSPGKSGTKAPRPPKVVQPKNPDGTAKNALDMKSTSLFGGSIKRINESSDEVVTAQQLKVLEKYLDKLWASFGIDVTFTRHFLDRVNDPRNKKQITVYELGRLFRDSYNKYGKKIAQLGPNQEAILSDLASNVNVPFALDWDSKNQELDLVAKTVMRKKDFKSPDPKFVV